MPDQVRAFGTRAHRLSLVVAFIETFDTPSEQREVIMRFQEGRLVGPDSIDLLIEHFGVQAS